MKKQEFLNAVEHEVRALKKYGTKEELGRMDIDTFNAGNAYSCIYGQMTGTCTSKRAKKLMDKSCIIVFKDEEPFTLSGKAFSRFKPYINGKNEGQGWNDSGSDTRDSRNYNHSSALEGYILMKGAKVKMIIKFLRGESTVLKL